MSAVISDTTVTFVRSGIDGLASRLICLEREAFPLSLGEVQSLLLPEDALRSFEVLESHGVESLPKPLHVGLRVGQEYDTGIRRGVLLGFTCYGVRARKQSISAVYGDDRWSVGYPNPVDGVLSSEQKAKFVEWCNRMVAAYRKEQFVQYTVMSVLNLCNTQAQLASLWPGLRSFVTNAGCHLPREAPQRRVPVKDSAAADNARKFIEKAELILTQASFLPAPPSASPGKNVYLRDWQRLEGDWNANIPVAIGRSAQARRNRRRWA